MLLTEFDYPLPEELIAQQPLPQRDASRMLVLERSSQSIQHKKFTDLDSHIHEHDIFIFNESKVIKARLLGRRKTGGQVECFVLEEKAPNIFECLLRSSASKNGLEFEVENLAQAKVLEAGMAPGTYRVEFRFAGIGSMFELLERAGHVPLPPYINRADSMEDERRYQTVFSRIQGSVAAPTAGLHFTPQTLEKIAAKGAKINFVTLHVGLGTFQPIKTEKIEDHRMHTEFFSVPRETLKAISDSKQRGGRVFCVGTTAMRALESAARGMGSDGVDAVFGHSNLFLKPGEKFQLVDALLTNFHQPKSSLLVLLAAFAGKELVWKTYGEALEKKYRFLSYGDCMLVL